MGLKWDSNGTKMILKWDLECDINKTQTGLEWDSVVTQEDSEGT